MKKIKPQRVTVGGACYDCERRARVEHACRTCDELVKAGKSTDRYSIKACHEHALGALEQTKRHALTKHPSNLLGATFAALKGEDVF